MPHTVVLFDIDGTLLHAGGAGRRALLRAFREAFGADARIDFSMAGLTDWAIMARVAKEIGVPQALFEERRLDLFTLYAGRLREEVGDGAGCALLAGVRELLDALSARLRVSTGLLTGNLESGAKIKMSPFGLGRYFAFGGYGSDSPERTQIYRFARGRFPASALAEGEPDVVIVGDTPHDVAVACAHGLRSLAVASGGHYAIRDLESAGASHLFGNLSDTAAVLSALGC